MISIKQLCHASVLTDDDIFFFPMFSLGTQRIVLLILFEYQEKAVVTTFLRPSGYGVTCLPGKTLPGQTRGARNGTCENLIQRNSKVPTINPSIIAPLRQTGIRSDCHFTILDHIHEHLYEPVNEKQKPAVPHPVLRKKQTIPAFDFCAY